MFGLIVPLSFVPDGTTVYRRTGSTPLTARRAIKVYSDDQKQRQIIKAEGIVYLVAENGSITACNSTSEVRVDLEGPKQALEFLWPRGSMRDFKEVYDECFEDAK